MVNNISPPTKAIGFWSAVLATVFSITYVIAQLAEWMGLMGSGGGASNPSTPLRLTILLTPSLFLGSSFLVLIVKGHVGSKTIYDSRNALYIVRYKMFLFA
jgi:hypothetical protein